MKAKRDQKAFSFDAQPPQPLPEQSKPPAVSKDLKAITKAYSLNEVIAAYGLDEVCRTIPEVVIEHLKNRVRKMPLDSQERKEAVELMRRTAEEILRKAKRTKD